MNQKHMGWLTALAGMGMMLGLLAGDVSNLKNWSDAFYPAFFSGVMTHIAAVITAFVGGNLVPNMFKDSSLQVSNEKRAELEKT
jgi:hypothetical protein